MDHTHNFNIPNAVLPRLLVVPSFNSAVTPADQLTIEYLHLIFNADTLIFGKDAKLVFREAENILLGASGRLPEGMAQQWWQYTVENASPLHVTWFTSCPNWFVWDSMSRKQQLLLHCRLSGTVFLVQADWILKLLLQSGKRYRCIRCCSLRLRRSFFPQAVRLTIHPQQHKQYILLCWKNGTTARILLLQNDSSVVMMLCILAILILPAPPTGILPLVLYSLRPDTPNQKEIPL